MAKGGGGQTSSTTVQQNYSPEEAARRTQVMDEAARIYGLNADSMANAGYPGAAPVPASEATQQAQQMMSSAATGNMTNLANLTSYGTMLGINAPNVQNNPYLSAAMEAAIRPITAQFNDAGGVLSNIRNAAVGAGQYGGTRQGIAEGLAGQGYLNAIGDVTAKMGSEAYGQGLEALTRTLGVAPGIMGLQREPAAALSAVGAQQEDLAGQQAQFEADRRMWQLNAPWMPLQNYANLVYGGANPGTVTNSTVPTSGGMSRTQGALAGAAAGAMMTPYAPYIGAVIGGLAGAFM